MISRENAEDLLDTLKEWEEHPDLGPKELQDSDTGLDAERLENIKRELSMLVSSEEEDIKSVVEAWDLYKFRVAFSRSDDRNTQLHDDIRELDNMLIAFLEKHYPSVDV